MAEPLHVATAAAFRGFLGLSVTNLRRSRPGATPPRHTRNRPAPAGQLPVKDLKFLIIWAGR
jgi:hypothetical protein